MGINLEAFGVVLDAFWNDLRILVRERKTQKKLLVFHFVRFKNERQILKFEAPGLLCSSWATPWRQDGPGCELGRVWGAFGRPLGLILAPSWSQDGAKLTILAPRCVQDG